MVNFPFWKSKYGVNMVYLEKIDNNYILLGLATQVILLVRLRHDGVQCITHLLIPQVLPQRWGKLLYFSLKKVHDQPLHSVFYFCVSISNKILHNLLWCILPWHVCKTLFIIWFLLSWLAMACNTDMLSGKITKLSKLSLHILRPYWSLLLLL